MGLWNTSILHGFTRQSRCSAERPVLGTAIPLNAKSLLRWLIRLLIVGFLARALAGHWDEVTHLTLREGGLVYLALGALVTCGAHVWAGVVWGWLLEACGHHQPTRWSVVTYLRTNPAKYLPGNVWHFVRRIQAAQQVSIPVDAAVLSVVLEAVLMVAAAGFVACSSFAQSPWFATLLIPIVVGVHPRWLNPVLSKLALAKAKTFGRFSRTPSAPPSDPAQLKGYPLLPLAGEIGFVVLRSVGFLLCVAALHAPSLSDFSVIVSAFALAWVAGMVIPGAPGGLGVFEAAILSLLQNRVPTGVVFGVVAAYRLISTGAEALGVFVPASWSSAGTPDTHPSVPRT